MAEELRPNAGRVDLTVKLLFGKSPFQGQRQQEVDYYFRPENYEMLKDRINVFPVWGPINGIRCVDKIQGFDNYLQDMKGNLLEESQYEQVQLVEEDGKTTEVKSTVEYDPTATARAEEMSDRSDQATGLTPEQRQERDAALELEKEYFTWHVYPKTLVETVLPRNFDEPTEVDNSAEWSYSLLQRPGAAKGVQMLAPFMKRNPPNKESPVHWALIKNSAIALNQGFEITYYFHGRESVVIDTKKDNGKPTIHKYNFKNKDEKPLQDYDLYSSVYLAFEIGVQQRYLFVFASDKLPACFFIDGNDAILVSAFEGFNPQKIFDPNNKYFNVSIEPVAGSFILRSNQFFDNPWFLISSMVQPFIIEESPIVVYGSNINASFSFRPLTYEKEGSFLTSQRVFRVKPYVTPEITCALKGKGEIEQNRSYNKNDSTAPQEENPPDADGGKIYMIDAEKLTEGESDEKDVQTVIEYQAGDIAYAPQSLERKVEIELIETDEEGNPITNTPSGDKEDSRDQEKFFKAQVNLTSSDVNQPSGYKVVDGKSPYIWMLRMAAPNDSEHVEQDGLDISCDVASIDLSWNAASYNEITQTGTIKILNYPNISKRDYKQYQNRTVYLTIDAGWVPCKRPEQAKKRIFTGLTVNAEVDQEAGREFVVFKIEDFMSVLQAMKIRLSPTYDGMKLSLAVADIVKMTGMSENMIYIDDKPVKEANLTNDYGLPFLNPFDEPKFRFKDGEALKESILSLAKIDFKSIFFDEYGNFHISTMPAGALGDAQYTLAAKFTTNDTSDPFNMIWNRFKFTRTIKDTYNGLSVVTVDKRDPSIIYVMQDVYREGIEDPNAEGYLGYEKPLVIRDAAIGSIDGLGKYLNTYMKRVYIPPYTSSFEIYGHPQLSPLKIVTVNGQPVRILNINSRIDATENNYWQSMEGEWIFVSGKSQTPAITPKESNNSPATPDTNAGNSSTS